MSRVVQGHCTFDNRDEALIFPPIRAARCFDAACRLGRALALFGTPDA
jgi:hypothetical protein